MEDLTIDCGIDVAAKTLAVACSAADGISACELPNTPAGHRKLAKRLTKGGRSARVCLEATGVYHLDLTLTLLAHPDIRVMVVNPRRIKDFSNASAVRSRNDQSAAATILEFLQKMGFQPWTAPSKAAVELRSVGRRITALNKLKRAEQCRSHAYAASCGTAPRVHKSSKTMLRVLEREIEQLRAFARQLIEADPQLCETSRLMRTVKGIGWTTAIQLMAELMYLPEDMTPTQWVGMAGLDPCKHTSGTSVDTKARISKLGNARIRHALFMPAMSLLRHCPNAKSFSADLERRGLTGMQIVTAVMRKLLRCIRGMIGTNSPFDPGLFRTVPITPTA